jgi:uncharacterized protein
MPYFAIHALDHDGKLPARLEHYSAHREFLAGAAAHGVSIAASGPLVSEDGTAMIGSLFIIDAPDLAAARAFNAADPFAKAEIWASVRIHRFDLRRGAVGGR